MSEGYILRGGGGGSLSPNSAVIHVTAPVGSTITFSKNGVIAKVLDASKSHVSDADPELADWYYAVSSSNYGSWNVAATYESNSSSTTVNVSRNRQYDIELSYDLYIIKNGIIKVTPELKSTSGSSATLTEENGYALFTATTGALFQIWVDITDYSAMHIDIPNDPVSYNWTYSQASPNTPSMGISITEGGPVPTAPNASYNAGGQIRYYESYIKFPLVPGSSSPYPVTPGTYVLDISEKTGFVYVVVGICATSTYGQLAIENFYLIKS